MPPSNTPRFSTCIRCGLHFEAARSGRLPKYCGAKCKNAASAAAWDAKRRAKLAARPPRPCANPFCDELLPDFRGRETCNAACLWVTRAYRMEGVGAAAAAAINKGILSATRVYFFPCADCGAVTCTRTRRRGQAVCKECRRLRNRRRDAFKSHRRRGSRPDKPLSVDDIAKRDGTRCHYCHRKVDLSLSGLAKWGPTVEHIICISWDAEAAKDTTQHVLAHRFCNMSRHNTKPSQMVLALGA